MFRNAVVTLLACLVLCFPACAEDLRANSAREYVIGFMGGDGGVFANSNVMKGEDLLFFLRRLAYPLSSWSWSQSVIRDVSVSGDMVEVNVTHPDISGFFTGKRPETVEEWGGYMSVTRTVPELKRKTEKVVLKINSLGELVLSDEAKKSVLSQIEKDVSEGLKWCRENPSLAPKEYVFSMFAEMQYSKTVNIPSALLKEVEDTVKILKKGDAK